MKKFVTAESVTKGHPDKICDQISDAILDQALRQDPNARVACEVAINNQILVILGEVTTKAKLNYKDIANEVIKDIGYLDPAMGFDFNEAKVYVAINEQAADIALGVTKVSCEMNEDKHIDADSIGAGDQGLVVGFACDETENFMPLAIELAHKLSQRLDYVREHKLVSYFRPDGKAQVTLVYDQNGPLYLDTLVVSVQHEENIDYVCLIKDVMEKVIQPIIPKELMTKETKYHINPTGRFVIGGPAGDSGLTGRKIIVDTYGGYARHGGGAFSGKDATKVDRSGAYMARYIAKNIVAAGLAKQCEVEIAYIIGRVEPAAVNVNTFGTGIVSDGIIRWLILECFDLRPAAIIDKLKLWQPIYRKTASYGHFGYNTKDYSWEQTDKIRILINALISGERSGNGSQRELSIQEKEEIQNSKYMLDQLDFEAHVKYYENLELPKCPFCSSENTATVQVGLVSRTINLSSRTKKFHLRANGKPANYFCNECKTYFDE